MKAWFIGAMLIALLQSGVALAQGDAVTAEALFREGRAAMQAGDYATACPKFKESQRLDPAAGTLLNLAGCEEHLGKVADSWQHFHELRERLPAGDDRIAICDQKLAALEPRLPRLAIQIKGTLPEDSQVLRDGVELKEAALGSAIPVNPGERVVVVRAPGHREQSYRVKLTEGETKALEVTVGPRETGTTSPEPGDNGGAAKGTSPLFIAGLVVGGVGVAGLVVGAVTGAMTLDRADTINDPAHCDQPDLACDPEGVEAASDGKTLAVVSTVGFIAGGALLAGGVVMTLVGSGVFESEGATVAVTPAQEGVGVGVVGTF